jgi:hypothetical protein
MKKKEGDGDGDGVNDKKRVALKDLTQKVLDEWLDDKVEIVFVAEEEIGTSVDGSLKNSEKCHMFTKKDLEDFFRPKRGKKEK